MTRKMERPRGTQNVDVECTTHTTIFAFVSRGAVHATLRNAVVFSPRTKQRPQLNRQQLDLAFWNIPRPCVHPRERQRAAKRVPVSKQNCTRPAKQEHRRSSRVRTQLTHNHIACLAMGSSIIPSSTNSPYPPTRREPRIAAPVPAAHRLHRRLSQYFLAVLKRKITVARASFWRLLQDHRCAKATNVNTLSSVQRGGTRGVHGLYRQRPSRQPQSNGDRSTATFPELPGKNQGARCMCARR